MKVNGSREAPPIPEGRKFRRNLNKARIAEIPSAVEAGTPQECERVGLLIWPQAFLFQPGQDEIIKPVPRPGALPDGGKLQLHSEHDDDAGECEFQHRW